MYIFDHALWKDRRSEFVESWKRVGKIARSTGFSEMVSHRALNPERTLQETRFANGIVVAVDFGAGSIRCDVMPAGAGD